MSYNLCTSYIKGEEIQRLRRQESAVTLVNWVNIHQVYHHTGKCEGLVIQKQNTTSHARTHSVQFCVITSTGEVSFLLVDGDLIDSLMSLGLRHSPFNYTALVRTTSHMHEMRWGQGVREAVRAGRGGWGWGWGGVGWCISPWHRKQLSFTAEVSWRAGKVWAMRKRHPAAECTVCSNTYMYVWSVVFPCLPAIWHSAPFSTPASLRFTWLFYLQRTTPKLALIACNVG